jgi:hypothetical protein
VDIATMYYAPMTKINVKFIVETRRQRDKSGLVWETPQTQSVAVCTGVFVWIYQEFPHSKWEKLLCKTAVDISSNQGAPKY